MATAVVHRSFARIGLLGNPSDGYFGKTISLTIANFYAEVTLMPTEDCVRIIPNPRHDPTEFTSLKSLRESTEAEGYYGGVRLLLALCSQFYSYCNRFNLSLPDSLSHFSLSYDTNIPRQAGLSGSSAILCAALSCLIDHFQLADLVPLHHRPPLILAAESEELGITAGLQDRVVQVFGGLVYMDFSAAGSDPLKNGKYTSLDHQLLPVLHLVYANNPSESGKVHNTVRQRWLGGDLKLRDDMMEVAELAEQGRAALESRNYGALAKLINRNFDLRREMFGDQALGALNIRMIQLARSIGAAAKFTGSGGAVVVFCPNGTSQEEQLQQMYKAEGFTVVKVEATCAFHQVSDAV